MKKNKISKIVSSIILLIATALLCATIFMLNKYGNTLTELLFYMFNGLNNTGGNAVFDTIKNITIPTIICYIILYLPISNYFKDKLDINIKLFKKQFQIVFPIKHKILYSIIILLLSLAYIYKECELHSFIKAQFNETKIYDDYYVNPKKAKVSFKERRNLVFIIAESMESSLITIDNGGTWNYPVINELEDLALNNVNFSHNDKIGGAKVASGTGYTVGGMVAETAGVDMSLIASTTGNSFSKNDFLNGAYALGDILKDNGYNLEIMFGSKASFGGRDKYFKRHGNYKIFDYEYASKKNLVDHYIWWGFEDYILFDFAKDELTNLAKQDKPFNLILLTADTHFSDGCYDCLREEYKKEEYDSQLENVYSASSKEINRFVNWIKSQDFYNNTTIVIIGDHLTMQNSFFEGKKVNYDDRSVYNVFINPAIETDYSKNRLFNTMDFYPTILASIGADIKGNRLGLGTNLFSDKKTLYEELGEDYVNSELLKKSSYYNKNIIGAIIIFFSFFNK